MKTIFFLTGCLFLLHPLAAQEPNDDLHSMPEYMSNGYRQEIRIPDIKNFITLKCDLHTHTVFSDGNVWPTLRVDEAWIEGLDAVAITDHIEYRPKNKTVSGDLNESYKIAKKRADDIGFLLIKGSEITRKKPDGHMNALFIRDANRLDTTRVIDALEEAHKQGAVIMLNHPGWPDGKSNMDTMHIRLMKEGKIQLVEVFNSRSFYPKVVDWLNTYDIAPAASTDIHDLVGHRHVLGETFRPMTLVFAKERSLEGIREALLSKRTVAFFNQHLAGKEKYVKALFDACITARMVARNDQKKSYTFEITNRSDIRFLLKSAKGTYIDLRPNSTFRMSVGYGNTGAVYTVENAFVGMHKPLETTLPFK